MSRTASADVLVVGAGLAGLHTATLLARRGHDVLLADRRRLIRVATSKPSPWSVTSSSGRASTRPS